MHSIHYTYSMGMGMGMSVSPHTLQQFVDLVFQEDIIKRKQNFDVIMDDISYIPQRKNGWIISWIYSKYYINKD